MNADINLEYLEACLKPTVFDRVPGLRDSEDTENLKRLVRCGEISTDDLIEAYQYQANETDKCIDFGDELLETGRGLKDQNQTLISALRHYADIQKSLDTMQCLKKSHLDSYDGSIDLRPYQEEWQRKGIKSIPWLIAIQGEFGVGTPEYTLAVILDEITRLKAKASRLSAKLRQLGEKAWDVDVNSLFDH